MRIWTVLVVSFLFYFPSKTRAPEDLFITPVSSFKPHQSSGRIEDLSSIDFRLVSIKFRLLSGTMKSLEIQ